MDSIHKSQESIWTLSSLLPPNHSFPSRQTLSQNPLQQATTTKNMAPPLPSSDSKLVYYKVLPHSTSLEEKITPQQGSHALTKCTGSFNGDTILSSKYEIKEVGSIFWDVTATAVDNAWDLVRDLKLRYHGNEFETRHYRGKCCWAAPTKTRTKVQFCFRRVRCMVSDGVLICSFFHGLV